MSPRTNRIRLAAAALAAALAVGAAPAAAVDVAAGRLSVDGYGYWGFGVTNANSYLIGNRKGEYANAGLALAITARPADDIVVGGQFSVEETMAAGTDWAMAEWRFSDWARLRVGKIRQPLGISNELVDVGTLRPFFTLPTGLYGPSNLGAEAYLGAGLTGAVPLGAWALDWDAYGGALTMNVLDPGDLDRMRTDAAFVAAPSSEEVRDMVGGRLVVSTPIDGLSFRASGYTGRIYPVGEAAAQLVVAGLSAEYATEKIELRAEAFHGREGDRETNDAGYAEVAWRPARRWQLAARADLARSRQDDYTGPRAFLRHRDLAAGVDFWVAPTLVFKAAYHDVDGYRFVLPDAGSSLGRTRLFTIASQFTF